jgi:aspartyl protease family protein
MPAAADIDLTYLIAGGAAGLVLLVLISRLPVIGTALRAIVSLALVAAVAFVLVERASIDPYLGKLAGKLNLGGQEVVGKEVRVKMAPNGHFFVDASLDGTRRRMMVDSGATITALSSATAAAAGLEPKDELMPVIIQTANGPVRAQTAEVRELRIGNIVARDLKVVVSPAFGKMDVIGMNLLSRLKSWRVEDNVLVLVPHHPRPEPSA